MFALMQMRNLLLKKNPSITIFEKENVYDGVKDKIYLEEIDFRMAFGFDSWFKSGGRNDPRYVKWIAQVYETSKGTVTKTVYPLKTCTWEDMKTF